MLRKLDAWVRSFLGVFLISLRDAVKISVPMLGCFRARRTKPMNILLV